MRISDWSSDVCSSDLQKDVIIRGGENISPTLIEQTISASPLVHSCCVVGKPDADLGEVPVAFVVAAAGAPASDADIKALVASRSEEHTSELQSLMRISYAVFCLKKKKNNNTTTQQL